MPHISKFRDDRLNDCCNMATFPLTIWRPSAILDFQKFGKSSWKSKMSDGRHVENRKSRYLSVRPIAAKCGAVPNFAVWQVRRAQFRGDRSNRYRVIAIFSFSRWRPSVVLDFQKLWILTADKCVIVPNFAAIGQTVTDIIGVLLHRYRSNFSQR